MAGWNAALCTDCWITAYPHREPVRVIESCIETCSECGRWTKSGIYQRRAPKDQAYLTAEEEVTQ